MLTAVPGLCCAGCTVALRFFAGVNGLMYTEEAFQHRLQRLSWDCRRGMKEVEMFICPFRDTQFVVLSRPEQEAFLDLLDCEDVDLLAWFTGDTQPDAPALAAIVQRVLDHAAR